MQRLETMGCVYDHLRNDVASTQQMESTAVQNLQQKQTSKVMKPPPLIFLQKGDL